MFLKSVYRLKNVFRCFHDKKNSFNNILKNTFETLKKHIECFFRNIWEVFLGQKNAFNNILKNAFETLKNTFEKHLKGVFFKEEAHRRCFFFLKTL